MLLYQNFLIIFSQYHLLERNSVSLKKFRQTADTRVSNYLPVWYFGVCTARWVAVFDKFRCLLPCMSVLYSILYNTFSDVFCLVWMYYIVFCITQYYYDFSLSLSLSVSLSHTYICTNKHTHCVWFFFAFRTSEPVSVTPSDMESLVDSAPTSLCSTRNGFGDDAHFGIRRFMEDLGIFSLFHSNIQSKVENTCYINSIICLNLFFLSFFHPCFSLCFLYPPSPPPPPPL